MQILSVYLFSCSNETIYHLSLKSGCRTSICSRRFSTYLCAKPETLVDVENGRDEDGIGWFERVGGEFLAGTVPIRSVVWLLGADVIAVIEGTSRFLCGCKVYCSLWSHFEIYQRSAIR